MQYCLPFSLLLEIKLQEATVCKATIGAVGQTSCRLLDYRTSELEVAQYVRIPQCEQDEWTESTFP